MHRQKVIHCGMQFFNNAPFSVFIYCFPHLHFIFYIPQNCNLMGDLLIYFTLDANASCPETKQFYILYYFFSDFFLFSPNK